MGNSRAVELGVQTQTAGLRVLMENIQRAAMNEECHLRSWSGVSQSPLAVMRACSTGFSVWSVGMHTGSAMYVLVYAHTLVCLVSLVCIPASSLHDSHAWFPSQKMIAADSAPN